MAAAPLRDLGEVAAYLRGRGDKVELDPADGAALRLPVEVTPRTTTQLRITWGDPVRLETPLGVAVPDDQQARASALVTQSNAELDRGRFVVGPPLAYQTEIERDAAGAITALALEEALYASSSNTLTFHPRFAPLAAPKPPPPSPLAIQIASKPIKLDPDVVERVKAACAADWPPFLHRFDGPLMFFERVQPWWRRHRVVDVQSPMPMPAVGIPVIFIPGGGAVRVLRGHLEHLVEMARSDRPKNLDLPTDARAYAEFSGAMVTDAQWGELPVASFDEIPFRRALTPAEKEQVHELRMKHGADLHAPRFEKTPAGFRLQSWLVSMSRLVWRELVVPPDGQLQRTLRVVADPIPVPPGKAWGLVEGRYVPVG